MPSRCWGPAGRSASRRASSPERAGKAWPDPRPRRRPFPSPFRRPFPRLRRHREDRRRRRRREGPRPRQFRRRRDHHRALRHDARAPRPRMPRGWGGRGSRGRRTGAFRYLTRTGALPREPPRTPPAEAPDVPGSRCQTVTGKRSRPQRRSVLTPRRERARNVVLPATQVAGGRDRSFCKGAWSGS